MRINFLRPLLVSVVVSLLGPIAGSFAQQGALSSASVSSVASAGSPNLAGLAHVALRVNDLDASVSFYEKLGFVRAFALSRDGKVYEAFIKINDRQFIELYPLDAAHPKAGFLHVCFEGEQLQAVHDFYVAAGLTPTAVKTAGAGNLLFTMPGPATPTGSQNMEYTQYMPGSLHSKDIGLHLGSDRIANKMMQVTIAVEDVALAQAFYVDKAGFVARSGHVVKLPGSTEESLALVPATALGIRSRIVLKISDRHAAEKALKRERLSYEKHNKELVVLDPDGNENVLSTIQ